MDGSILYIKVGECSLMVVLVCMLIYSYCVVFICRILYTVVKTTKCKVILSCLSVWLNLSACVVIATRYSQWLQKPFLFCIFGVA